MAGQHPDDYNGLDDELRGLFARATADIGPRHDLAASVQRRLAQGGDGDMQRIRTTGVYRSLPVAATLAAVLVVALLAGLFVWFGPASGHSVFGGHGNTPAAGATATPAPFHVSSVSLAVQPSSIAGMTCGSTATFAYTATFSIPANTSGGTIHFSYSLNNGRSQTPGSVQVASGATSATYTFTSSGTLPADHTYPAPALVLVDSPNSVESNAALPSGQCAAPGAFKVTSVTMAVSPSSMAGTTCGTYVTVTYTATFHLAANGPGGTIQFYYTVNNGRGDNPATLTVAPGQTTATYQFSWAGNLPSDHTMPEGGGVVVRSPSSVSSGLLGPSGRCS
jgi:hypothetical protein